MDGDDGVRLDFCGRMNAFTVSARWGDVVISFNIDEKPHRMRLLQCRVIPLSFDGIACPFRVQVVDRDRIEGTGFEVDRFRVSFGDEDGNLGDDCFLSVLAEAVEYQGPDDPLPQRWPNRAEFWGHAHLPLDYGE